MKMSPLHQHEKKRTQAPATVVNTLFPDNLYTMKPINASHKFAKYCIIQTNNEVQKEGGGEQINY